MLHQKLGRKSRSQRKKVQKKMLNYAKRNYRQLAESIDTIEKSAIETPLVPDEKKNLEKMKDTLARAGSIIDQQKRLIQGEKIGSRIVSFYHQDVRPMVRGKYPVNVEFGRKLLLVESGGTLELAASFWDNVSDTRLVGTTLDYCEEVLGLQVKGLGADRGFHSGENRNLCRDRGLTRIGIQRKGRPGKRDGKKRKKPRWEERLRRRRCGIEGRISVAKRCYGLDRALYRIENGEEMWSRLGLCAYNLKKAVSISKKSASGR